MNITHVKRGIDELEHEWADHDGLGEVGARLLDDVGVVECE